MQGGQVGTGLTGVVTSAVNCAPEINVILYVNRDEKLNFYLKKIK